MTEKGGVPREENVFLYNERVVSVTLSPSFGACCAGASVKVRTPRFFFRASKG